jgi:carbamoyltransferase
MPHSNLRTALGISVGHGDSSAALVVGNELVAAVEEERFTRLKHYALFPEHSIRYCLERAGLRADQIQTVAIARDPWMGMRQKIALALRNPGLMKRGNRRAGREPSLEESLQRVGLGKAKRHRVEHHLAHMLSARYVCPTDNAALLSFDGLGDFVSTAFGSARGNQIKIHSRIFFPHSVGFFYTAMTQYLGFPYFGDEFKVMGLSSYGTPRYLSVLRELITETPDGFRLNLEAFPILKRPIQFSIEKGQPYVASFYNERVLAPLLGISARSPKDELTEQHRDLAKSIQVRFEEVANHLLGLLHKISPEKHLALAGGCAHNSVWVGKIPQSSPFQHVHVAPAAHDSGIAVGAAIAAAPGPIKPQGDHWALLGPGAETPLELTTEELGGITKHDFDSEDRLIEWMVDELCAGKILGLLHGRMEFGPRALGSRSILADPRPTTMRDRLNVRVKHREIFRPFAASVLWEQQHQWFEHSFFCPSMEAVFEVKPEMRSKIPAVVHADQTCRIQSVTRHTQPFYWKLIESFRKRTGVPMLINTSFNDSEPIVCTPRDAFRCFLNSDLDHLVVEKQTFSKAAGAMALPGRKAG